jgi:hypothetical protein
MSLFEDNRYRWRETYFVLFRESHRPNAQAIAEALQEIGGGFQVTEVQTGEDEEFEALTVVSPSDFCAMDISYVDGEEVAEQVVELKQELKRSAVTKREQTQLEKLSTCNARFDIFHFERVSAGNTEEEEEDDCLDPGTLLMVLKRLAKLCHGISVDPQSGILM